MWLDLPWEAALPRWVSLDNGDQALRLERFLESDLWTHPRPNAD